MENLEQIGESYKRTSAGMKAAQIMHEFDPVIHFRNREGRLVEYNIDKKEDKMMYIPLG